jgi:DICT domain-containing protein
MQSVSRLANDSEDNVRIQDKYAVRNEKHSKIVCNRRGNMCSTQLFTEQSEKLIAVGSGENQFEAIWDLREEVTSRANASMKSEYEKLGM